jgi:hypothetical protein
MIQHNASSILHERSYDKESDIRDGFDYFFQIPLGKQ